MQHTWMYSNTLPILNDVDWGPCPIALAAATVMFDLVNWEQWEIGTSYSQIWSLQEALMMIGVVSGETKK